MQVCHFSIFVLTQTVNISRLLYRAKYLHHHSKINLYFPLTFRHELIFVYICLYKCNVQNYHLSGFEINNCNVTQPRLRSSTLSKSPCLCTVKQWDNKLPWAWSYCILSPLWVYSPYFHFHPAGINQPITFCSEKFFMSVQRCSMFQNHSATDSINQYYHGNVGRAPLTPTPPYDQWRGKAIM